MIEIEFAEEWEEPEFNWDNGTERPSSEESNVDAISVFRAIVKSEVLPAEELYELGCYLKTYAEVHHVVG